MEGQMGVVRHTRKLYRAQRNESMLEYLNRNPTWIDNKRNRISVWILSLFETISHSDVCGGLEDLLGRNESARHRDSGCQGPKPGRELVAVERGPSLAARELRRYQLTPLEMFATNAADVWWVRGSHICSIRTLTHPPPGPRTGRSRLGGRCRRHTLLVILRSCHHRNRETLLSRRLRFRGKSPGNSWQDERAENYDMIL